MANISDWLTDISDRVPGAQKTDIESAIRAVIREFCTKTMLWTKQLPAISIVSSTPTYTLTAPTDTAIVAVERVEINGVYVDPVSQDVLDRSSDPWRSEESSLPSAYMVDAEKVLRLKEIPTEDIVNGLIVWVAVKPSITTSTIPDFIVEDWYETILNGVVSYLLRMPGKSWTNVQGANYFEDYYSGYISEAKNRKVTGKAKVSIRMQPQPFSVVG